MGDVADCSEKPPLVLVVDACRVTLNEVHAVLRDEYRVLLSTNGEDSITVARQHQPDVILLDIAHPGITGIEICCRLKSFKETENIPVMFMGACLDDQEHAFKAGGADFLNKPLNRQDLRSRIYNQIRVRSNQQLIKRRALYDDLTRLPGRTLTFDRLRNAMTKDKRDQLRTAILFIDLDNFKGINDTLGHEAGDRLLIQASLRFKRQVREGDTVGRLGGDEFAIVLTGLRQSDDAKTVAEGILKAFDQPICLHGVTKRVGISIGVAIAPDDEIDAGRLIACADTAMYQAKRAGRNCIKFFTSVMNLDMARRVSLENNLRSALENQEVSVHYQPVLDLERNVFVGVEALARWRNAALGVVSPAEFVRQAEHSGLIWEIGAFVMRQACEDIRGLRNELNEPLRLSVNVSPQQIRQPQFPALVETTLKEVNFPPELLEIEVTEELVLKRGGIIADTLRKLHELGVHLALDDFGTGLSSLSHLSEHCFDSLKVDGVLVEGMLINAHHDALVGASIAIAKAFKLNVIAEGVETEAQMAGLRAKNCRFAQGNFICPAVPFASLSRGINVKAQAISARPNLRLVDAERAKAAADCEDQQQGNHPA